MADPRLQRSRDRVLAAAIDVLREVGSAGLTVEAVAARSGVAKSTIYRQFESSEDIHSAAIESVGRPPQIADTGDVLADIEHWMQQFVIALRVGDFATLLPSAIESGERSAKMASLNSAMVASRRALLIARLRLGVRHGQLQPTIDVDLISTQLVAPLFYRRFVSRQPTSRAFVIKLAKAVLSAELRCDGVSSEGDVPLR